MVIENKVLRYSFIMASQCSVVVVFSFFFISLPIRFCQVLKDIGLRGCPCIKTILKDFKNVPPD